MKTLWTLTVLALLAAPLAAAPLTDEERGRLLDHLERTRDLFLDSVADLSEAQWSYKAAEDRWSIAECAEHIALSEEFLRERIGGFLAEPASADRLPVDAAKLDTVLTMIVDRSQKFQAPEPLVPTRRWATPAEALAFFTEQRAKTAERVGDGGDLHSYVGEHPAFGDLDAYVWFFFLSGHTERHTLQIEEVKADPGFPAS